VRARIAFAGRLSLANAWSQSGLVVDPRERLGHRDELVAGELDLPATDPRGRSKAWHEMLSAERERIGRTRYASQRRTLGLFGFDATESFYRHRLLIGTESVRDPDRLITVDGVLNLFLCPGAFGRKVRSLRVNK
jgi:hypothetical protein